MEGFEEGAGLPFFRCALCGSVVNVWDIEKKGKCPKCSHARMHPTDLSYFEILVQIIKHPLLWKWKERKEYV